MKRRFSLLLVVILAFSLIACSKSLSGKYVNKDNNKDYIEFKSDKTFYVKEGGSGYSGEYKIDGDEITFTLGSGEAAKCTIKGNSIIDEEDEVWEKK